MHGYAERRNGQSRVEAGLAFETDPAPETDLAPSISDQRIRWLP
jgi:hypothetical protein